MRRSEQAHSGGGGASENAYYINGFPVTNPLTQLGGSELPFGAIAALLAFAAQVAGCIFAGRTADSGTGSETTNHIAGVVWESESTPAARTRGRCCHR